MSGSNNQGRDPSNTTVPFGFVAGALGLAVLMIVGAILLLNGLWVVAVVGLLIVCVVLLRYFFKDMFQRQQRQEDQLEEYQSLLRRKAKRVRAPQVAPHIITEGVAEEGGAVEMDPADAGEVDNADDDNDIDETLQEEEVERVTGKHRGPAKETVYMRRHWLVLSISFGFLVGSVGALYLISRSSQLEKSASLTIAILFLVGFAGYILYPYYGYFAGPVRDAWKYMKKHKVKSIVAAVATVSILVGVGVYIALVYDPDFTWLWTSLRRIRDSLSWLAHHVFASPTSMMATLVVLATVNFAVKAYERHKNVIEVTDVMITWHRGIINKTQATIFINKITDLTYHPLIMTATFETAGQDQAITQIHGLRRSDYDTIEGIVQSKED